MSDISEQVAALIKELLSLNRSENTPMAHPPSADDFEQRQSKRKRVRQELVLALSLAACRVSSGGVSLACRRHSRQVALKRQMSSAI